MIGEGGSTVTFDVVVIGAGHNGLTCAAYLAKAGLEPAVVEMSAAEAEAPEAPETQEA